MAEFIGAFVQLCGHGARGGGQGRGGKRSDERSKPNTTNCICVTLPTVPARVLDVMTYVLLTLFARVTGEEGPQGSLEVDGRILF